MATVPFRQPPSRQGEALAPSTSQAPPPEVYQMMAAVAMQREGRLVKPGSTPDPKAVR